MASFSIEMAAPEERPMIRFQKPVPPRGIPRALILAIAGIGVVLAGCNHGVVVTDTVPADYRNRHPIVINEGNNAVEVFVGNKRGGLTPAQRADVLAFAHAWQREASGGILIDLPTDTGNARAADASLAEIKAIFAAAGVPPHGVNVRPYRPADPRTLATIRLNYPRMVAEAGPCGIWAEDLGPSTDPVYRENRPHWNHGCAHQRNLAAMIDNPADLVQPRGDAPAYRARRTIMLDKYRKGENPATTFPANQGKISDIGQ
jgi:pilus assembly protein CpaD